MKGKSVVFLFMLLLVSVIGFYGLLIMISMIHSGDMTPNGGKAAASNMMGFLMNYVMNSIK